VIASEPPQAWLTGVALELREQVFEHRLATSAVAMSGKAVAIALAPAEEQPVVRAEAGSS
jgi:hypothetical protein